MAVWAYSAASLQLWAESRLVARRPPSSGGLRLTRRITAVVRRRNLELAASPQKLSLLVKVAHRTRRVPAL